MNTGFYADLDTNFEQAFDLSGREFTHEELLELLKNGNIPQKQIAALKFDKVCTKDDAQALLNNLTGCDGKIREAAALKINQIIVEDENARKIFADLPAKTFSDATIDINANICRLVVDSVKLLKFNSEFVQDYTNQILEFTNQAFDELDKFIFRDKKYVINKQLFKLYWCLEALKYFYDFIDEAVIKDILEKSSKQSEYTIREKVAQIAVLSDKFQDIRLKLSEDENYYVRAALNH